MDSYLGVREIPVERIIGSLDRTADFDRSFRPRRGFSRGRLAGLRGAFPDGRMPPIEVQELGGAYFVADGHHRVALAREREADFIDAEVTRLQTNYEVGPDVDVCQLVHTEQQRVFLEESGLGRARPNVLIEFSRPGGYPGSPPHATHQSRVLAAAKADVVPAAIAHMRTLSRLPAEASR